MMAIMSFLSGTLSKPVQVEVDKCLNIEHMKKNYYQCCANNGFKINGRQLLCTQAGEHVKRKLEASN